MYPACCLPKIFRRRDSFSPTFAYSGVKSDYSGRSGGPWSAGLKLIPETPGRTCSEDLLGQLDGTLKELLREDRVCGILQAAGQGSQKGKSTLNIRRNRRTGTGRTWMVEIRPHGGEISEEMVRVR